MTIKDLGRKHGLLGRRTWTGTDMLLGVVRKRMVCVKRSIFGLSVQFSATKKEEKNVPRFKGWMIPSRRGKWLYSRLGRPFGFGNKAAAMVDALLTAIPEGNSSPKRVGYLGQELINMDEWKPAPDLRTIDIPVAIAFAVAMGALWVWMFDQWGDRWRFMVFGHLFLPVYSSMIPRLIVGRNPAFGINSSLSVLAGGIAFWASYAFIKGAENDGALARAMLFLVVITAIRFLKEPVPMEGKALDEVWPYA